MEARTYLYVEYGLCNWHSSCCARCKHDGGFYTDNQFLSEMAKKFEGKLRKGETVYYESWFVNEYYHGF